jgi:sterol desaturase/sphingolipid hydroxylase (fatty acid hydroxylase superfamily)
MTDVWNELESQFQGALMTVLTVIAVVFVLAGVEMWRKSSPDGGLKQRGYNITIFCLNSIGMVLVGCFIFYPIGQAFPEYGLIKWLFPNWQREGILGIVMATAIYAIVTDFFHYWLHRAEHRFPILWTFHRTHHSDTTMNASTSVRHSIGSGLLGSIFIDLPTYLICGGGFLPYAGAVVLYWIWLFITHMSVQFKIGKLGLLLVGPQYHRIHHGKSPKYYDRNFAEFFPFYDWLFGTQRLPQINEWPATGVEGFDAVRSPVEEVFFPWCHPAAQHRPDPVPAGVDEDAT